MRESRIAANLLQQDAETANLLAQDAETEVIVSAADGLLYVTHV